MCNINTTVLITQQISSKSKIQKLNKNAVCAVAMKSHQELTIPKYVDIFILISGFPSYAVRESCIRTYGDCINFVDLIKFNGFLDSAHCFTFGNFDPSVDRGLEPLVELCHRQGSSIPAI